MQARAHASGSSSAPCGRAEDLERAAQRRRHHARGPRRASSARSPRARWRAGCRRASGTDACPAAPQTRIRSDADPLLAHRDRDHAPAVGQLEQRAAALVDREVAAQVGALAHEPRHADVGGVALLVGLGDQDDVARRAVAARARARPARRREPRARPSCRRPRARPARRRAPRRRTAGRSSLGRRRARRRCGPSASATGPRRARDARDEVESLGIGADQLAFGARVAQVLGEELGGRGLAARRVGGVEPDQRPRELDDLLAQAGLATGARRRASWRTASIGNASCIVPSSRSAGRAATRQLRTASCAAS